MNGKRYQQRKSHVGMYLAIAVCLAAVGVAAWSTYDAVNSYTAAQSSASAQAERDDPLPLARSSTVPAPSVSSPPEKTASQSASSTVPRDVNPAAPSPAAGTPSPLVSSPVRETAGEVTETPQEEQETEAEITGEEIRQTPATAPLYERSTEMIAPVEGEVQSAYSAGAPVYSETMKDWRIHAGADLAAQAGEAVKACANGQVVETRTDPLLGNVVVIEHGDYVFSYCGVSEKFQVKAGDVVSKGQVVGTVTAVPFEAAQQPHLHLEVRRDGAALDPMAVLQNP